MVQAHRSSIIDERDGGSGGGPGSEMCSDSNTVGFHGVHMDMEVGEYGDLTHRRRVHGGRYVCWE